MKSFIAILNLSLTLSMAIAFPSALFASEPARMEIAAMNVVFITQQEKYKDLGYGYLLDYIIAATEASNLTPEVKFYPPKRAKYEFVENNVMFTIGHPGYFLDFVNSESNLGYVPLIKTRFLLHYYKPSHPDGIEFNSFDDLHQYRITIHRSAPSINAYLENDIDIFEFNDPASGFGMLKAGRVDLVETADAIMRPVVLSEFPEELDNIGVIAKPTFQYETGLVYKNSNEESVKIIETFKQGLVIIQNNGKANEILKRYFGSEEQDIWISYTGK